MSAEQRIRESLFPPVRSRRRSVVFAAVLHVLLLSLVLISWHLQKAPTQDDAAPAQVGLWTAADLAQASHEPPPKHEALKPPVLPPVLPKRELVRTEEKPPEEADIHLGQKQRHVPRVTPKPEPSPEPSPEPKRKPRPTPVPKPEPTPDLKAAREKQRLAQEKAEKLAQEQAQAKAKAVAEAKAREKAWQKEIDGLRNEAKNAGQAGGSTTSKFNGQGKSAYKPSDEYQARVSAVIKRHTIFDANDIVGNPSVEIQIRLSADGEVLGRPIVLRPSGNPAWDAAAVAGIQRASPLPVDKAWGGKAPPPFGITRTPKDEF